MAEQVVGDGSQRSLAAIAACQKVLRSMTAIILVAFVLIIVLTTASTSPVVQVTAKALYYLILAAALTSLMAWIARVRLQKKTGEHVNVVAEIMKKV